MKAMTVALLVISALAVAAQDIAVPDWNTELRKDHPRLLLNADMLPAIRERAHGDAAEEYKRIVELANAPVETGRLILDNERFTYRKNGKIKMNPGLNTQGDIIKNMNVKEASSAAMVWLVDRDPAMRDHAIKLLEYLDSLLVFALRYDVPVDYHTEQMMNLMCAYDWMYNDLTPEQRTRIGGHLAGYVKEMQPDGRLKVFKTTGAPDTGFYGTYGMLLPAGIVLFGSGVDPALVEKFLNDGWVLAVEAMRFRDKVAGDKGLLVAATPTYSFGAYPLATFLFMLENRSALGRDARGDYSHMRYFINWFLWATIPDGHGRFHHYGYGDVDHRENRFDHSHIYGHLTQVANMYADIDPEVADRALALRATLPPELQHFNSWHPFMPLLMTNLNGRKVPDKPIGELAQSDTGCYFPVFGLAFMRTGYRPDATFAVFRSGAETAMHQHYDENSFIIYRNGFLALDTGTRLMALHHTNYYPQTVAHNAILIDMPNESMPGFWWHWTEEQRPLVEDGKTYFCDGGQNDREHGRCRIFETCKDFTWVSGDATASYSPEKCKLAQREFVFLPPRAFAVFDRVESAKPEYAKRWLLHTENRPVKTGEWWRADNGTGGELRWRTLTPENAGTKLIGGPGMEFFASGRNFPFPDLPQYSMEQPNFYGRWRQEVIAPADESRVEFLNVLDAAVPGEPELEVEKLSDRAVKIAYPDGTAYKLVFNADRPGGTVEKTVEGKTVFTRDLEEK